MDKRSTVCMPFYYDCVIEDAAIYFPLANYNAICQGNLWNDEAEIIEVFPGVPADTQVAYSGMYKYKEDLIFFPYRNNDHDIKIYNLSQKKFSVIHMDKNIFTTSCAVFERNHYLYAVSSVADTIYKIDLLKKSIAYIAGPCSADNAVINETARNGNVLFIPVNQKRTMLVFDLETEEFQYYKYPQMISYISTLCCQSDRLWISGEERKIFIWNIKDQTVYECAEFPESVQKFQIGRDWFARSFIYRDILWLFPDRANRILKYHILTEDYELINIQDEEEKLNELESGRFFITKYAAVNRIGKKVYFLSSKTRILYEMNLDTNDIQKHCFHIENTYHGCMYPQPVDGKMYEENYQKGMETLLCFLQDADKKIPAADEMVGIKIHDYISKTLK